MNFGSHTDAVVTVAVALVNVATPGERRGQAYTPPTGRALAESVTQALRRGSPNVTAPSARDLPAFVELAETVRPVFELLERGRLDDASAVVNRLLARYQPVPSLEHHDGEPWHLHFHGNADTDPSGWGGGVAVALATVLGGSYADRLGVCQASSCDRVYVDVSRNGTRRFCGTACQNRVKAAAHRQRNR